MFCIASPFSHVRNWTLVRDPSLARFLQLHRFCLLPPRSLSKASKDSQAWWRRFFLNVKPCQSTLGKPAARTMTHAKKSANNSQCKFCPAPLMGKSQLCALHNSGSTDAETYIFAAWIAGGPREPRPCPWPCSAAECKQLAHL